MGIRSIFWLAFRELKGRPGRSLLSLLSLSLSVGLIAATGSIGAWMRAGVASPAPLVGQQADLWISSAYDADYDLSASLVGRVASGPGVESVLALLRRPVRVETPPSVSAAGPGEGRGAGTGGARVDTLTLVGADLEAYFRFHGLQLAAGNLPAPGEPGLVALAPWAFGREVVPGQLVTLTIPAGRTALPVTGLLEIESLASIRHGLVLYAPRQTVAELFGLGDAVTLLEVRLQPGATTGRVQRVLEQTLGPAYSVSATNRPGFQLWQRLILGALGFVDALTLLASICLVYAIFSLSARARRRHIALLRVAGAHQRDVLAMLLAEALLLGIAGSLAGLALGLGLARAGGAFVLEGSAPTGLPPMPAATLLLAATAGIVAALGGAMVPTVRAARQPPIEALWTVSPLTRGGSDLGGRWPFATAGRLLPGGASLPLANLSRERRRAFGIILALSLVLAMFVANVGVLSLLGEEIASTFGRLAGGDYLVLPALTTISFRELAGQDTSDVPPLAPVLLEALEGLSGQAWLMGGTTADVEALEVFAGQPTLLLDIEAYAQMGGFRFREGNWARALEVFRQGPAILLAPVVARRLGVGLGDPVPLPTLAGSVGFEVAGIGDSEFTTCVLDLSDGVAYFGVNEVNAVMVQVRPGAARSLVRQALVEAVRAHGGTLLSLSQASAQLQQVFAQARLGTSLLIGASGLVALLGVVNAMLSSTVERRREIGLLRAVGATPQQVIQMIVSEGAILGAIAALLGLALGWVCTLLFAGLAGPRLGLSGASLAGWGVWRPLLAASAAGLLAWPLLAMLGAVLPALAVARLPVIQALYEGGPGGG
ncbi:MAG: ABC transporter permease [Anaerolineae bacterium]|nr:ABC transporter permease [Anaerolineae bacterium]